MNKLNPEVEIFKKHLEGCFERRPGQRRFGYPQAASDWADYCDRTQNSEVLSEEKT